MEYGCEAERPAVVRDQEMCFNNCSGAGRCLRGWCHCQAGRWGIDCSRTKVRRRACAGAGCVSVAHSTVCLPAAFVCLSAARVRAPVV
jgi:hypothetical protein